MECELVKVAQECLQANAALFSNVLRAACESDGTHVWMWLTVTKLANVMMS